MLEAQREKKPLLVAVLLEDSGGFNWSAERAFPCFLMLVAATRSPVLGVRRNRWDFFEEPKDRDGSGCTITNRCCNLPR